MHKPNNTRSQDFRNVYANVFGISFGPNEALVTYGIQTNPGTDDLSMEEQVGVILSHAGAKLLSKLLTMIVEDFEESAGAAIPIEQAKIDGLAEIIVKNKEIRKAAAIKK